MAKKAAQSIEPEIADLVNGWLKSYKLKYKLEQAPLNPEIDKALKDYESKSGGTGANRPDAKLLLCDDQLNYYPILIEYKGYKDKLVKLNANGQVENKNGKNEHNYKNIKSYAVNGAIHYANAILHYTNFTDIIAIGVTGYKDEFGNIQHEIGVYYVSKKNFGIGQKVGEFSDLSFLAPSNFNKFIKQIKSLSLTQEELDKLKEQREKEIEKILNNLNNEIYGSNPNISTDDRLYLVAASIIATLGIPKKVIPLEPQTLKSSTQKGETDGDKIMRTIEAFLEEKELPIAKKNFMLNVFKNTLSNESLTKVENGTTELKNIFTKIIDRLGIYYKIGLTTDFTGMLFNEMYSWIPSKDNQQSNDVVLTPPYVAKLLVKLARINRNSYVWDFATGSAGLLVAAMNEMLIDAKLNITSANKLIEKEKEIKASQLLGLEILPSISMLAILNMILMGDGSSNILNKDSLTDFDGNYGFGNIGNKFPADAFILNPPYSASGNGMIFVEKALNMMDKGFAAIIIQNSAGSGKAIEYNKRILAKHTLIASIKMPIDIFVGKSSVQTYIYVFRVNEPHLKDDLVKFIDFSDDGYTRTNRKKANCNLKDTNNAKGRYSELIDLVRFGRNKLSLLTNKEYYEGTIDPNNGADWNQSAPINERPTLYDFRQTISKNLAWEVSGILTDMNINTLLFDGKFNEVMWQNFKIGDLFEKIRVKSLKYKTSELPKKATGNFTLPALTAGIQNQGLNNYVPRNNATILKNVISISANGANTGATFYQKKEFTVLQDSYAIKWKNDKYIISDSQYLFFAASISKAIFGHFEWTNKAGWERVKLVNIQLPINNGEIDFKFMDFFIVKMKMERIEKLKRYLQNNL